MRALDGVGGVSGVIAPQIEGPTRIRLQDEGSFGGVVSSDKSALRLEVEVIDDGTALCSWGLGDHEFIRVGDS